MASPRCLFASRKNSLRSYGFAVSFDFRNKIEPKADFAVCRRCSLLKPLCSTHALSLCYPAAVQDRTSCQGHLHQLFLSLFKTFKYVSLAEVKYFISWYICPVMRRILPCRGSTTRPSCQLFMAPSWFPRSRLRESHVCIDVGFIFAFHVFQEHPQLHGNVYSSRVVLLYSDRKNLVCD